MEEQNIATVNLILAAWNAGDIDGVLAHYDDDIVFDFTHYPAWLEEPVISGRDPVRAFLEGWSATWQGYEQGIMRIEAAGDRVVAITWQRAAGRDSGAAAEMTWGQMSTFRDGKVLRLEQYSDTAEALAAIGMSE